MAPGRHTGRYLPVSVDELVRLCKTDGGLRPAEGEIFLRLCKKFRMIYAFHGEILRETLKTSYRPLDPDADTPVQSAQIPEAEGHRKTFTEAFHSLLTRANFRELSESEIEQAFKETALVDLKIHVGFADIAGLRVYVRSAKTRETMQTHRFRKSSVQKYKVWERAVILIQYRTAAYFMENGIDPETLDFIPGKTYLFYYKNLPQADLEGFFPHIRVKYTPRHRAAFLIVALFTGLGTVMKIYPRMVMTLGLIVFLLGYTAAAKKLGVDPQGMKTGFSAYFLTIVSVFFTLIAFIAGQLLAYRKNRNVLAKKVADMVFFRILAANRSVVDVLVDEAASEETKEVILAYYHMRVQETPVTAASLDEHVEAWFVEKTGRPIDFDVTDALAKLAGLSGKTSDGVRRSICRKTNDGRYAVEPAASADATLRLVLEDLLSPLSPKKPSEAIRR
jgi:hypothetical protein